MKHSKNNRAKEIVWLRETNWIPFDLPMELWYKCPICKIESEWLCFSEYNWFLYCQDCNKDYPSVLCLDDIDKATEIYLDIIQDIKWT